VLQSLKSRINVRETLLDSFDERRSSTQDLRVWRSNWPAKEAKIDNMWGFL
jgi:hypothetical protein